MAVPTVTGVNEVTGTDVPSVGAWAAAHVEQPELKGKNAVVAPVVGGKVPTTTGWGVATVPITVVVGTAHVCARRHAQPGNSQLHSWAWQRGCGTPMPNENNIVPQTSARCTSRFMVYLHKSRRRKFVPASVRNSWPQVRQAATASA